MSTSVFEDADLVGDKLTRFSQTWIVIFSDKSPTHWFSKDNLVWKLVLLVLSSEL